MHKKIVVPKEKLKLKTSHKKLKVFEGKFKVVLEENNEEYYKDELAKYESLIAK